MIYKPIVSVIIPVYNSAMYIEQAIESVLVQKVPFELIIIDDCSSDSISDVLDKYKLDYRIKCVRNKVNLGVAMSRNLGVNMAQGDFIAYLDADDWWMPDKLEKQLKVMNSKKYAICYTERELVYADGKSTGIVLKVKEKIDYRILRYHNYISCSSVMLPTYIAKSVPMCHDELHEDYINWLKILKIYGMAYGIKEPLIKYRLSENGKSRNHLKSAKMTYGVFRYVGMNKLQSLIFMVSHLLGALIKYKVKPKVIEHKI